MDPVLEALAEEHRHHARRLLVKPAVVAREAVGVPRLAFHRDLAIEDAQPGEGGARGVP